MMSQLAASLVGGLLLAISLGLFYMAVTEKLGWPDNGKFLGMAALVWGIVLLAIAPYIGGIV